MNTKNIPALVTLSAGLLASVIMYLNSYELHKFLWILFFVLLGFFILGSVLRTAIDRFDMQNAKEEHERSIMEALEEQRKREELQDFDMGDGDLDGSVIKKRQ